MHHKSFTNFVRFLYSRLEQIGIWLSQFLTGLTHFKEPFRQCHVPHYSLYTSVPFFLHKLSSTSFRQTFPLFNSNNSTVQNLHWNLIFIQPTVISRIRFNPKLLKSNAHFTLLFSGLFFQLFAVTQCYTPRYSVRLGKWHFPASLRSSSFVLDILLLPKRLH